MSRNDSIYENNYCWQKGWEKKKVGGGGGGGGGGEEEKKEENKQQTTQTWIQNQEFHLVHLCINH